MLAVALTIAAILVVSIIVCVTCITANYDPANNRFVAAGSLPAVLVFLGACVCIARIRMLLEHDKVNYYAQQITGAGEVLGEMWEAIVGPKQIKP